LSRKSGCCVHHHYKSQRIFVYEPVEWLLDK
jgi:hypothetical protein